MPFERGQQVWVALDPLEEPKRRTIADLGPCSSGICWVYFVDLLGPAYSFCCFVTEAEALDGLDQMAADWLRFLADEKESSEARQAALRASIDARQARRQSA